MAHGISQDGRVAVLTVHEFWLYVRSLRQTTRAHHLTEPLTVSGPIGSRFSPTHIHTLTPPLSRAHAIDNTMPGYGAEIPFDGAGRLFVA